MLSGMEVKTLSDNPWSKAKSAGAGEMVGRTARVQEQAGLTD